MTLGCLCDSTGGQWSCPLHQPVLSVQPSGYMSINPELERMIRELHAKLVASPVSKEVSDGQEGEV